MDGGNILLIVREPGGEKVCINLFDAIEAGAITLRINSVRRAKAVDVCEDCPENRAYFMSIDDELFGTSENGAQS